MAAKSSDLDCEILLVMMAIVESLIDDVTYKRLDDEKKRLVIYGSRS